MKRTRKVAIAERDWRISKIGQRGRFIGHVRASDSDAAIKAAIKSFKITDREQQRRLVAQPLV